MSARALYHCGTNRLLVGGNKAVYRHVEIIADAGIDAWVFHPVQGFRY